MSPSGAERLPSLVAELRALQDPADVVVGARELLVMVRDLDRQVGALRDAAIRALHSRGSSLQEIADLTGLSRGRVHQILRQP